MFIAILDFATSSQNRPAALSQLFSEQSEIRAMPGCINFRAFESPENDTDVTALHEWESEEAMGAYLRSDAFTRSGKVLGPLLTGPPTSRRMRAELIPE